jgi:hypothetical protein
MKFAGLSTALNLGQRARKGSHKPVLGLVSALALVAAAGTGLIGVFTAAPATAGVHSVASVTMAGRRTQAPGQTTPGPTVIGPIAGTPATTAQVALSPYGYVQQEFFVRGTATRYVEAGRWRSNGHWAVNAAGTAPYETRILVRRPADPARFNGTVVVEWLDSPRGVDEDIEFDYEVRELLRAGYAWVGVSTAVVPTTDSVEGLQKADPARYAKLTFPGISYSYSIFSQVAEALKHPHGVAPLGGLRPRALIADGDSGGAHLLLTYYNAIEPVTRLFSGFLLHSRAEGAEPISGHSVRSAGQKGPKPPNEPAPAIVHVRTGLPVPVLDVQTEFDVLNNVAKDLESYPSRQPDSQYFRLWELAGAPHADLSIAAQFSPPLPPTTVTCKLPVNNGGQEVYAMDTALASLNRWIQYGVPPREFPLLDVTVKPGHGPEYVRNKYGDVIGGMRTPDVQVPIAALSGSGNTSPGAAPPGGLLADVCLFVGTSHPLSRSQLKALYPTHQAYVAAVTRAAMSDVAAGVLLPADAWEIIVTAQQASVP